MTNDVERFITAIRETIETQLADWGDQLWNHHLLVEGQAIDLDQLARAVHQTVIDFQSPPF